MTTGQKIMDLREQRGLTRQQLASAAGIGVNTLARIELHDADLRLSTLKLIAKALKVPVSILVPTLWEERP